MAYTQWDERTFSCTSLWSPCGAYFWSRLQLSEGNALPVRDPLEMSHVDSLAALQWELRGFDEVRLMKEDPVEELFSRVLSNCESQSIQAYV